MTSGTQIEVARPLTAADARAAGLPLDVLAVVQDMRRGARLRWRLGPAPTYGGWELEQLDQHPGARLRWVALAAQTGDALAEGGLVYPCGSSRRGELLYYGLAADRDGVVAGEGC